MSRLIEIRPFRGGWQCWEGDGIEPYWIGAEAQEQATSYATVRAKGTKCEIRVVDGEGKEVQVFRCDQEHSGC